MGNSTSKYTSQLDLVSAAQQEYDFLKSICDTPELVNGDFIPYAVQRYERCWLPLAAEHGLSITAPIDIEWVWQVHMLSPYMYRQDCVKLFGKVIDHCFVPNEHRAMQLSSTEAIWKQKYPSEPFHLNFKVAPNVDMRFDSRLTYDLIAAAARQRSFVYQVSLPHFKDAKFLKKGEERYKLMLLLKKKNPSTFIVPCYDNDLIWHTHQLHPLVYEMETVNFLGKMLNHDDSDADRTHGSKLYSGCKQTKQLFAKIGKRFEAPGALYRGDPPPFARMHNPDWSSVLYSRHGIPAPQSFCFIVEADCETHVATQLSEAVKYPAFIAPDSIDLENTACQYSTNKLVVNHGMDGFFWRVTHCKTAIVSVVELLDATGNLLASGHTIGTSSLPFPKQVQASPWAITFKPKIHKAILIRNSERDWAILRGSWKGFKTGNRNTKGSLGRLGLDIFSLEGKKVCCCSYAFAGNSVAKVGFFCQGVRYYVMLDLKDGKIEVEKYVPCLPEVLCMCCCIAVMFVLCHPRPPPQRSSYPPLLFYNEPPAYRPNVLDVSSMSLLVCAGLYNEYLPKMYSRSVRPSGYSVLGLGDGSLGYDSHWGGGGAQACSCGGCGGGGG